MTEVSGLSFSQGHSELLRARATARNFDAHMHTTYSVVAIKKGNAFVRSARWSRAVSAGDVFFFNPYEVHAAIGSEESVEYETLYPLVDFLKPRIEGDGSQAVRIETDVLSGSDAGNELLDVLSARDAAGGDILEALERVLRLCEFSVTSDPLNPISIARRACEIIGNNTTHAIRTEDLAREIGVHESHFIRAFTKATGLAPQTYLRQVRVAQARDLISSGHTLSDVAQMLGFCDQAHFSREFKKVFGAPPGTMSRDIGPKKTKQGR